MRKRRVEATGLLLALVVLCFSSIASAESKSERYRHKYEELLAAGDTNAVCAAILADAGTEDATYAVDALGDLLAVDASKGTAILDLLAEYSTVQADSLRADLLVWLARGDEMPRWKRDKRTKEPEVLATEELCQRSAELLDHTDPVVRGLAEWAIAIRLGMECEGRKAKPWPSVEESLWFQQWSAIGSDEWLDFDYVRQLAAIGWHRTPGGLRTSADRILGQAEGIAAYIRSSTAPHKQHALDEHVTGLHEARKALLAYLHNRPEDLSGARRRWLVLRHALRDLTLSNPDVSFDRILFATRSGPENGNITNGGVPDAFGPGAAETATLKPAFVYRFDSRFTPDSDDIQSYGQSYYECDGFYRNKAMLIDDRGMWIAWKPSAADAVELIYSDDDGAAVYSLEVGRGLYGVDIWPKMSLTEIGDRKYITYFTGYAKHRTRFMPDNVEAALREMHGERFSELPDEEIEKTKKQAEQAGIWRGDLEPPRGPAELAVFDVQSRKLKWTYNVSMNHPSLPANEFWTYLDKTAMVVAGRWAYVGWVDREGADAVLRLLAFDILAATGKPAETAIPLGFPSAGNRKSALFDLIAVDGVLYALVTQSDRLSVRDPRWMRQHVIAIR